MRYLDLTLPTPQDNLACDEVLMDWCENHSKDEVLRFWEPKDHFVVLGYSNKISREVNPKSCKKHGIPIFRRPSGGGTVLQGPGCLNYSLILQIKKRSGLNNIRTTNRFIMQKHEQALSQLIGSAVELKGLTDLTLRNLKFSGNAQRRSKSTVLFHGTFLLEFDLGLVDKLLPFPSRAPDYRKKRTHSDFLTNIPVSGENLKRALKDCWSAQTPFETPPLEEAAHLAASKYTLDSWNHKL